MPATAKQYKEEHIHLFVSGYDLSESRCNCGAIKVSEVEMERRTTAWNDFYQEVEATPAYVDFQAMRQAYSDRDLPAVKEIMVRVKERQNTNDYLSKPSFPDPVGQAWRYVIS